MSVEEVEPAAEDGGSSSKKKPAEYDDLLRLVGGFGRFQQLLYAFTCVMSIPSGMQLLVQVFYGAVPSFSCAESSSANHTCEVRKCCANCTRYEFHGRLTSAVSEWDLMCDRSHLKAMTQAVYMAGLLVGSLVFSSISDHLGRRLGLFISIAFTVVCGVGSALSDCLSLFAIFRFGSGAGNAGVLLVRFVYCLEMAVTSSRTAAGFVNNIFTTVGFSVLALLAYLIRDWRYLILATCLPNAVLLPLWWWVPESPRWLMARGRLDEARQVLESYATKSGKTVNTKTLETMVQEVKDAEVRKTADQDKPQYMDLLRTRKMRKRTVVSCFNWFVNSLVYYGSNLNVKNLGGDMYLSFFILVVVEVPASLFCWFCLRRFGRRVPYCTFMILGGVASALVGAVPSGDKYRYATVALALIAKSCFISTFLGIYVFTCELYPTVIRNTGIGFSSMMSRIGGILAPYVVLLADLPNLSQTVPMLIFGVSALSAGIMALWLPETLFSPMAQTVEEAEAWDEDYRNYCCVRSRPARDDGAAFGEIPRNNSVEMLATKKLEAAA